MSEFIAPTGRGQDRRQTSAATECRRRVPQCGNARKDKAPRAELGAGRVDGAIQDDVCHRMWQDRRQTSAATECRRRVPQCGFATKDKAPCAELGAGRVDGAVDGGVK